MAEIGHLPQQQDKNKTQKVWFDDEEYQVRRRLPPRLPRRNIDVYISPKTDFKAQLSRCESLLAAGETELIIHALGAAIPRALNLANVLENKLPQISVSPYTTTVELTDNYEPHSADNDTETGGRYNSALHIRVTVTHARQG